ncbi:hypothetical protein [Okeania sp. KiyG1]|uniref:hypothetical protein n=1 Tax=Okeania sp. KiyG1 TaxID=2720165 RepID=UPI00192254F6|nr:hypothetical protein [Okeania sp. KiyG1]
MIKEKAEVRRHRAEGNLAGTSGDGRRSRVKHPPLNRVSVAPFQEEIQTPPNIESG